MEGISQDALMFIKQAAAATLTAASALATTTETPGLWHRRFGHLGYDNLFKLKNKDMVQGIAVSAQDFKLEQEQKPFCEACILAKQQRLPFPQSDSKSSGQLELVHMDVCGPLQVPSTGGARYLATFTDDYSRLAHVVPVAQKSDVPSTVRAVINMWETQSDQRVKAIRTDRGREYLNTELQGFLNSKGIIHNTTAPYTLEQNGVAERFNRTLMERVRAMLTDAKLGEDYWAEAASQPPMSRTEAHQPTVHRHRGSSFMAESRTYQGCACLEPRHIHTSPNSSGRSWIQLAKQAPLWGMSQCNDIVTILP